jgi:hypothetical protein
VPLQKGAFYPSLKCPNASSRKSIGIVSCSNGRFVPIACPGPTMFLNSEALLRDDGASFPTSFSRRLTSGGLLSSLASSRIRLFPGQINAHSELKQSIMYYVPGVSGETRNRSLGAPVSTSQGQSAVHCSRESQKWWVAPPRHFLCRRPARSSTSIPGDGER